LEKERKGYPQRKREKVIHIVPRTANYLRFFVFLVSGSLTIGRKKIQSLDFPDPFQAKRLPIISAKSDYVSCCCPSHPRRKK
jgi:hypothetical protein